MTMFAPAFAFAFPHFVRPLGVTVLREAVFRVMVVRVVWVVGVGRIVVVPRVGAELLRGAERLQQQHELRHDAFGSTVALTRLLGPGKKQKTQ